MSTTKDTTVKIKKEVKWGPLWATSLTIGIYFISQILAAVLLFGYYYIFHFNGKHFNNWLNSSVTVQFFYVLIIEIQSIGIIWLFLKWKNISIKAIGLVKFKAMDLLYAISAFGIYILILYSISETLSKFIKSFNLNQQQDVGFHSPHGMTALILTFFSLVILPPIAEEIIFRGFLFSGLRNKMKFIYAALITSVIFAMPHLLESQKGGLLWVAGLDTFTLSIVSCFLRDQTKTLWPSILLHSLKNFLAFSILFLI
ncbi:MAG: CPBP family intramembrane glutamic endopeptidase [bacterium]